MALKIFEKILPFIYDIFMFPLEKLGLRKLRGEIFKFVKGYRILEIGVGTGLNIPLYPNGFEIICVEPKFWMIKRAIKKAKKFKREVSFVCAKIEALPFENETFDTVFATFVFCEVKNPEKGFQEILRVLKPNGRLILLEHVRPDGKMTSKLFDIGNKLTSIFGENINRETVKLAIKSGFVIEKAENIYGEIVKFIIGAKMH